MSSSEQKAGILEQTTKKEAISTNKKIILFIFALLSVLFLTAQTCTFSYLQYDYDCSDGLKSLGEADVDCGGAYCDLCSEGNDCDDNNDCASGLECDETTDTCVATTTEDTTTTEPTDTDGDSVADADDVCSGYDDNEDTDSDGTPDGCDDDDDGDGYSDADETAARTDSLDATSIPAAKIYTVPSPIASDCSKDVTDDILSWIASVPDGSTLLFGSNACYRVEGTLNLLDRSGLVMEGNGATFHSFDAPTNARAIWRLIDSSDFVFRNMKIQGSFEQVDPPKYYDTSELEWGHAIDLWGSSADIEGVTASGIPGDCFAFGLGWSDPRFAPRERHSAGSVRDSTCLGANRNAVSVIAGDDIVIERVTTSGIGYVTFLIEPDPDTKGGSCRVTVTNNIIGSYGSYAWAIIAPELVCDQWFTNNRVIGQGLRLAVVGRDPTGPFPVSNVIITGNTADTATNSPAIVIHAVEKLTFTGNTIPMSGGTMAIAEASCNIDVSGNSFQGGSTELEVTNVPSTCP